jgi:hypothetical protein
MSNFAAVKFEEDTMARQGDDSERHRWTREDTLRAQDRAREDALRVHDRAKDFEDKTNEATIAAGQVALRTSVLINGGAAVAVLAFIGGLVGHERVPLAQVGKVAGSLMWFAAGVAVAGAALALSYCTHFCHVALSESRRRTWDHPYLEDGPSTSRWQLRSNVFHWAAIIVGLSCTH